MPKPAKLPEKPLRIAFIHPDLGIGGAERLVVDAALGLQQLGHSVDLYTSHHDPNHCFEETKDGSLKVHFIEPPFPRSWNGKFHIVFAHLRQLHLTYHILTQKPAPAAETKPKSKGKVNEAQQIPGDYDVYFVDQLSTCVPLLRLFGRTRVVFYCHFPDKLLAHGGYVEGASVMDNMSNSFLKTLYRLPMDFLEEITTRQADVILANSLFTARVFKGYFPSIASLPKVVYPGINLAAYEPQVGQPDADVVAVMSPRPTLLSLNRFEGKKNAVLALESYALLKEKRPDLTELRLVVAGGYDPRLQDNIDTLKKLCETATSLSLSFTIISPVELPETAVSLLPANIPDAPQVVFLINFTTPQRTALLQSSSTLALVYTPANEHFGIVPVEAMACGLPVVAANSGGPTESVVSSPPHTPENRTGWLVEPTAAAFADALLETLALTKKERENLKKKAKSRAQKRFGMEAMAKGIEEALIVAAGEGRVPLSDIEGFDMMKTIFLMILGFLGAVAASPYIFGSR